MSHTDLQPSMRATVSSPVNACQPSRMRKKSASGVLASLRGSPYGTSTIRVFARCGLAGRSFCASCGDSATDKARELSVTSQAKKQVFLQPARCLPRGRTAAGSPRRSGGWDRLASGRAAGGGPSLTALSGRPSLMWPVPHPPFNQGGHHVCRTCDGNHCRISQKF